MEGNEKKYWQERAALLDPRAYVLRSKANLGAGYSETVPEGENWLLINVFYCRIAGGPLFYNHRVPDIDAAVPLTSGTRIEFHSSSSYSMYYSCRPQLVIASDSRYEDDPKGLYFDRLNALKNIQSSVIGVNIPYGTANGNNTDSLFPADFDDAICTSYSANDVSWAGLAGNAGAMNLGNEISDDHQQRQGHKVLFPFSRSIFPRLRCRGSNAAGNTGSYMSGNGQITYVKLPSAW